MLSYLHSFHAGNRADLHKHGGLLALLAAMRKNPEPLTYIETHSGRGRYDLHAAQAKKTGEFLTGAATLWQAKPPPRGLAPLVQAIQAENEDRDDLRYYPGSPMLAAKALRQRDRLELCELHPKEAPALRQALARFRRAKIRHVDGLEWVKSAPGLQGRRALNVSSQRVSLNSRSRASQHILKTRTALSKVLLCRLSPHVEASSSGRRVSNTISIFGFPS